LQQVDYYLIKIKLTLKSLGQENRYRKLETTSFQKCAAFDGKEVFFHLSWTFCSINNGKKYSTQFFFQSTRILKTRVHFLTTSLVFIHLKTNEIPYSSIKVNSPSRERLSNANSSRILMKSKCAFVPVKWKVISSH